VPVFIPLLVSAGGNIAVEIGINRAQGRKTTPRDLISAVALGVIPGAHLTKYVRKGGPLIKQISDVPFYKARGLAGQVGPYLDEAYALSKIGADDAYRLASGTVKGIVLDHYINRKLDRIVKESRGQVQSLTSRTQSPRQSTKILARSAQKGKKKTSRRTVSSRKPGRTQSYCKVHRKYDFCEKYNIRK
jgi:hypothetical protein